MSTAAKMTTHEYRIGAMIIGLPSVLDPGVILVFRGAD
jgi:hypothetical protein